MESMRYGSSNESEYGDTQYRIKCKLSDASEYVLMLGDLGKVDKMSLIWDELEIMNDENYFYPKMVLQ